MPIHAIPAHERLDLHGDLHLDALESSPKKPRSEERKDRSGPKLSLFDFMELRQLHNRRKISLWYYLFLYYLTPFSALRLLLPPFEW